MKHPPPLEILLQRLPHVKGQGANSVVGQGEPRGWPTEVGMGGSRAELSFSEMSSDTELIFFDGDCGLCHAAVRFVLAHDHEKRFRFAPLQGETFLQRVPEVVRSRLPDTLVVSPGDDRYLLRSDGVLHVLGRLGRPWRMLGRMGSCLPRRARDRLYDAIAARRARFFERPGHVCPVVTPELQSRFDP